MTKELLLRYDKFFGSGVSQKLLDSKKYTNFEFIRINLSKTKPEEILNFLNKNKIKYSTTFLPNSLKIEKSFFNLSSAPEAISGKYYLQDLASQIPINLIELQGYRVTDTVTKQQAMFGGLRETKSSQTLQSSKVLELKLRSPNSETLISVLDMAASPGSKTTQIADILTHNKINYKITALEPEKKRLLKLINNIQKQGFINIRVINSTGESFKSDEKFDIILLDAPCSGNLVGDKDWLNKRDLKGILEKSELQKKLLENASKLLKKDGVLIYSTCSLEIEENELNVLYAEKNLRLKSIKTNFKFGFETDSTKLIKDKNILEKIKNLNCIRIMPYLSKTQGFFVTIFIKN